MKDQNLEKIPNQINKQSFVCIKLFSVTKHDWSKFLNNPKLMENKISVIEGTQFCDWKSVIANTLDQANETQNDVDLNSLSAVPIFKFLFLED